MCVVFFYKENDWFIYKYVFSAESDFETFLLIKNHFKSKLICDKELFNKNTRPKNVQNLYEAAGKQPAFDCVDAKGNSTTRCINNADGTTTTFLSNSDPFEQKKNKLSSEIETRLVSWITTEIQSKFISKYFRNQQL